MAASGSLIAARRSPTRRRLLAAIRRAPVDAAAALLDEIEADLSSADWDAVLYAVEELAAHGEGPRAERLMGVCGMVARRLADRRQIRATTYFLGDVYQHNGKQDQAMAAFRSAAADGLSSDDDDGRQQATIALGKLAQLLLGQGRVEQGIETIREALAVDDLIGSPTYGVTDRLTLANILLTQEDFAAAEKESRTALRLAKGADLPLLASIARSLLASIRSDLNDPAGAASGYREALATLQAMNDSSDPELWLMTYADAISGLGIALQDLGQIDAAADAYREAAHVFADLGDRRTAATITAWLGTAELDAGRPRHALRIFNEAARLARSHGDRRGAATIAFYRAAALQTLRRFADAEAALLAALAEFSAPDGNASEHMEVQHIACLAKLGELALVRGRLDQAVTLLSRARAGLELRGVGAIARLVYARLGEAYWRRRDFAAAYDALRRALEVYEERRRTVRDVLARISFGPSRDAVIGQLAQTCRALGRPTEALEVVEQGRARVFREQLAHHAVDDVVQLPLSWAQIRNVLLA